MVNGRIIGSSIAAGVALLSFMGYGIIGNEVRNIDTHTEIRKELTASNKEVVEKVDSLKDVVMDVRLEQMQQRGILERIEGKL